MRGYLIGSGWKDYQANGQVCGIALPPGLKQASKLPAPIFTPATKAAAGQHDENVSFAEIEKTIGRSTAARVRELALALYDFAAEYARGRGILIADTKFEFGLDAGGEVVLMDEALTPDSSRFWPADSYREGTSPPSFDKQYVRDYLETLDWNKRAPGPRLPPEVIAGNGGEIPRSRASPRRPRDLSAISCPPHDVRVDLGQPVGERGRPRLQDDRTT